MENNIFRKNEASILELACEFIAKHEGLSLVVYICPGGVKTIGYGHALRSTETYNRITEDKAKELLLNDTANALLRVLANTKVPLNANQQVALTSFVFNLGLKAYIASTLRQKLNRGEYYEASREFYRWVYAGGRILSGLVKRRREESELFLKID